MIEIEEHVLRDLHWMARRYADNRSTYVTSHFNDITKQLLKKGLTLNPTGDGLIWARDGQGRDFDGLTEAEATPHTHEATGGFV